MEFEQPVLVVDVPAYGRVVQCRLFYDSMNAYMIQMVLVGLESRNGSLVASYLAVQQFKNKFLTYIWIYNIINWNKHFHYFLQLQM